MSDRFRVSSLLRMKLVDLGISPETVLAHARLPSTLFEQDRILLDTEGFFALYQAIADVSDDPLVGLRIGDEDRVERYDPVATAAVHARTFGDALERAARFKQLTCPEHIGVFGSGAQRSVQFEWTLAERRPVPALLTDLCFAWITAIGRRGSEGRVSPLRVEYARPPLRRAAYEAHFGCPVRFGARQDALVYRREDLDHPFVTHNADLLALVSPQLEQELTLQRAERSPLERVKVVVKRRLAGRRPDLEDVARELGQSARTLQRRLAEEGATYQGILEDARRELARHYLLQPSLELTETAYLLGYEDANSFFRAFHQWEGVSPGRWRELHQPGRTAPRGGPAARSGRTAGAP